MIVVITTLSHISFIIITSIVQEHKSVMYVKYNNRIEMSHSFNVKTKKGKQKSAYTVT